MICIHYIPWDRYDSYVVKISECEHWSGDHCQRNDCPTCQKPWSKEKKIVQPHPLQT